MSKEIELAKIVVRIGERLVGSVQDWTAEGVDDPQVQGRIEAALAFAKALQNDVETVMSITELYKLSTLEAPEPVETEETEEENLRRLLQLKTDEAEMWQTKFLEVAKYANQEN